MVKIESVWSENRIKAYVEDGFHKVSCPVCHNETFDNDAICPHCGWQYDYSTGYSSANRSYKWWHRIKYHLKKFF